MAASSEAKLPGKISLGDLDHQLEPLCLAGELVVARAHKAQHLAESQETAGRGGSIAVPGTLSCTNYCFHFEPDSAQGLMVRLAHSSEKESDLCTNLLTSPLATQPPHHCLSLSLS